MGAEAVAGVIVAVCGAGTAIVTFAQSRRASSTAVDVQHHVAPELTISQALHAEYTERLAEAGRREGRLQELLRVALRLIRRQNRRLAAAGLDPEPVPDELIPYSIS